MEKICYPKLIALSSVIFFIEMAITIFLLSNIFTLPLFMAAHFIVCLIVFMWLFKQKNKNPTFKYDLICGAATSFLGPFGSGGFLLCILFMKLFAKDAEPFDEWIKTFFPDHPKTLSDILMMRLTSEWEDINEKKIFIPFYDILKLGTIDQKQIVLQKISQYFTPLFAPILREALNDSNHGIRVQAASFITKIEKNFYNHAVKLKEKLEDDPKNTALIWQLASLYDDFTFLGLIDLLSEENNRKQALHYYKEYLKLKPFEEKGTVRLVRLLMRMKNYLEAEKIIEEWLKDHAATSFEIIIWYCEIQFHKRNFSLLREKARYISNTFSLEALPQNIRNIVDLWS